MKSNKLPLKLNLIYIMLYGALACLYPFLTVYFQQRGLSYTQIGIAYAIFSLAGIMTQPIWGFVTDKYSNKRTILIIMMIVSSLVIYNFVFAVSFYYIIASIILTVIFQNSIVPITDAYSYAMIAHHRSLQYGKIRLMGSFGYAVVALLLGQCIKRIGIESPYFIYSVMMMFGAALVYSIDFKDKASQKQIRLWDVINLIKDCRFSLLLISLIIANIALGSNGSYISLLIQETGGDVTQLGLMWFIIAMSELPALFFGMKLIRKYGELNLYLFGMALFTLRYFLNSICTSYISVLVIQFMQSITYTFYLLASLQYLNSITPAPMRTSAMTLYATACGIGGLIGNMGGGMLLENISIFMFYKILSFMCMISLGFIMVLKHITTPQNREILD